MSFVANFKCTAKTLSTIPGVHWSFRKRFNPKVVEVLQKFNFPPEEALKIASNFKVRTFFAGKLGNTTELFKMGVGTKITEQLKEEGLLGNKIAPKIKSETRSAIDTMRWLMPKELAFEGNVTNGDINKIGKEGKTQLPDNIFTSAGEIKDSELKKYLKKTVRGLMEIGLNKEEIIDLLKSVEQDVGLLFAWEAYWAIAKCLPELDDAGLNKEGIIDLLRSVAQAVGKNFKLACEALPELVKAELNKEEIIDFLKSVEQAAGEYLWEAYWALPKCFPELYKAGKNKKEGIDLIKSVAQAVGPLFTKEAYWALPKYLPELVKAGLNKEKIIACLKNTR